MNTWYPQPQITRYIPPPSPNLPLVGRERESTLVRNQYEIAKHTHASVVLISGDPGIGKTRFLDEIAAFAAQDGATVLRGGSSEAEGMPPYLPFLEALGQYIQAAPLDQLRDQLATMPQVLTAILPELADRLGDPLISPHTLPPEQERLRLYEAIGTFLEIIGAPYMLVLVLDDLHWADTASLDLLCHIARRQSNAHLLIIGAYRESEANRNPILARTVAELTRQRVLTSLILSPLTAEEIQTLAINSHGCPLNPDVNALLYTQSEGNPFFAEELLHNWIEMGAIVREENHWVAVTPLEHALPPSIVGALRQRIIRLSAGIIDHLRVAAIIGRTFEISLLALVKGQEIETLEESLLEAIHARLIRTDEMGRFTFSHDKIRECLYAEVSTSRRRRLHGVIGQILESRYAQERTMSMYQLAELAFHFTLSSDKARGIDYSQRTAAQAMRTYAASEAMVHYRAALELLSQDDSRRGDLLLGLAEAALLAGNELDAEVTYTSAQKWLLQAGDQIGAAQAAHGLGLALWRQEKRTEALGAFEHTLELLGERQCSERATVMADLSVLLTVYMGEQEKGMNYAQLAMEVAQNLGDARLEAMARRILAGNLSIQSSALASSVQFLEETLKLAEESSDLPEACECCLYLTVANYWLAEINRSHEVSMHRLTLIERCQQQHQLRTAYTLLALIVTSQGKWEEAEQMIAMAQPVVDHIASPMPLSFLNQIRGFLAYQREDYTAAERELQAAIMYQDRFSGLGELAFYFGLLGLVQATMGKQEEAIAYMARLETQLALLPVDILPTAPILMCLTLTAIVLGEHQRAIKLYPRLLAFQGQHYWFLVDRILGLLATLNGDWKVAEAHLTAAEATARREKLLPELARTLLGQADAIMGQEGLVNSPQVRHLLSEALILFETLSMEDSASRTRYRLQSLSHQPQRVRQSSLPANLTEREVAVLKLVTYGKSNSQIAQELVISEKTVANHLTHIFNKTNSENRVAAATFAIRHGLA
jgi:DNA-binding CsgD family transcriptional regulator/tetratricopeptide (TPR) repeat protein